MEPGDETGLPGPIPGPISGPIPREAEKTFAPRLPSQRQTVTSNLTTTIDFLKCSPTPRVARDAAHVTCNVSEEFGYPHPPRVARGVKSRFDAPSRSSGPPASPASDGSRFLQVSETSIPLKPSFAEELRSATAWTAWTAWTPTTATPSATPPEPIRLRLPTPSPSSPSAMSPAVRRSLAELDLLVAEAESKVRNLELGHPKLCMTSAHFAPSLEVCFQTAEQALLLTKQRARAFEGQEDARCNVAQRMHLAALRASIAELDLRFERLLSSSNEAASTLPQDSRDTISKDELAPPIVPPVILPPVEPVEPEPAVPSVRQVPSLTQPEELLAKCQDVQAQLETAQAQIDVLRKEKAELVERNQKLEEEKKQWCKDQDLKRVLQELDEHKATRQTLEAVKDLTPPAPAPVVPVVPVAAVAVAPPSRSEAVAVEAVEVTGPLATTWRQPGPSPSEADA